MPCFGGSETPLIRPLFNSSTFRCQLGKAAVNQRDLTLSAVVKIQRCELFPMHSAYLFRMRGGISRHQLTSESKTQSRAVNTPKERGDIPHAEFPERTVHTHRQLQPFHRFPGRRKPIPGSRGSVNRYADAPSFGRRAGVFGVACTSQSYEKRHPTTSEPSNVSERSADLPETK